MEKTDKDLKQILLECKCATRLKLSKIAIDTVTYLKEQRVNIEEAGIPEHSELFVMISTLSNGAIVSAPEGKGIVTKNVPADQVVLSRQQVDDLIKDFKDSANNTLNKIFTGVRSDVALATWKFWTILQSLIINIELSLD